MPIDTVKTRLAALAAEITGITTAFRHIPPAIDTADLPCQIVFTGRSRDDETQGNEFTVETREYRLVFPVLPHGQGARTEAEAIADVLIPQVKEFYRARKDLVGLAWVQTSRVLGDSGVIQIREWDGKFLGFEVILEVTEYVKKTFVDY
jgi:hypothetical protein